VHLRDDRGRGENFRVSILIQARLYRMISHSVLPVFCSPHDVPLAPTEALVPWSSQPRYGSSEDPVRFISRDRERRASLIRRNRCVYPRVLIKKKKCEYNVCICLFVS